MTYLPPDILDDTEFPTAGVCAKDINNQLEMINEKWRRSFPLVDYFQLKWTPTETGPAEDYISGVATETKVDDLWGEDIPDNLTAEWVQPHETTPEGLLYDAADTRQYDNAVLINAALDLQPSERTLKKVGIDEVKGIMVTIPVMLLDEAGITVKMGDFFVWRGERYEVLVTHDKGYWFNTNIYLYLVLDCKRQRIGS